MSMSFNHYHPGAQGREYCKNTIVIGIDNTMGITTVIVITIVTCITTVIMITNAMSLSSPRRPGPRVLKAPVSSASLHCHDSHR